MSKQYTCDVTVCFCINNFNADSEKEYMQKVKNSFKEQYDIWLTDREITNIKEISKNG